MDGESFASDSGGFLGARDPQLAMGTHPTYYSGAPRPNPWLPAAGINLASVSYEVV